MGRSNMFNHNTVNMADTLACYSLRIRYVLVVVIALTLATVAGVLVIIFTMPEFRVQANDNVNYICLSDSQDRLNCGANSELLGSYIEQLIQEKFEKLEEDTLKQKDTHEDDESQLETKSMLKDQYWDLKPAARLTGVPVPSKPIFELDDGLHKIPRWQSGGDSSPYGAYTYNGVQYRNGNIVAPVAGVYHVYSFIHLEANYTAHTGCPDHRHSTLQHAIYKFNILNGTDNQVLSKTHLPKTPYREAFTCSFYHSYVSVTLQLNAGDEMFVKISDLALLKLPKVNYFGLTLI